MEITRARKAAEDCAAQPLKETTIERIDARIAELGAVRREATKVMVRAMAAPVCSPTPILVLDLRLGC